MNTLSEVIDYKTEYVYACISSGKFKLGDIARGSGVKYNTIHYIASKPKRVLSTSSKFVNQMYLYFKSFDIPIDKLKDVKRREKVEYYIK